MYPTEWTALLYISRSFTYINKFTWYDIIWLNYLFQMRHELALVKSYIVSILTNEMGIDMLLFDYCVWSTVLDCLVILPCEQFHRNTEAE